MPNNTNKAASSQKVKEAPPINFLLPQHKKLIQDSAIIERVAEERGYRSITDAAELSSRGFSPAQRRVPGLLIPIWGPTGENGLYQFRPDDPRRNERGKPVKYETLAKARMALDVPPGARAMLGDPSEALFITEGARKADAAVSGGLCCVSLLGVWNWRGTNAKGGKTALPEWESIALNDRQVFICFDSDVTTKPEVHQALARLKKFLESRKARVSIIQLPDGPDGAKVGLDDFLAAGNTPAELLELASPDLPLMDGESARVGGYWVSDGAICREQSTRDGSVTLHLCNFDARITHEDILDDGAEQNTVFTIEGTLRNGKPLPPVEIQAAQFPAMNWPTANWGNPAVVYAGMGAKDHLRAAIQLLSGEVPRRTVYGHFGWRKIGGEWIYLHAGGAIGAEGAVEGVTVSPGDSRLVDYIFPDPLEGAERKEAIRASLALVDLAAPEVTVPLLAAIYRAVLGEALPVDLTVFLAGTSGSQKTELTAIAQAHFGAAFTGRNLPANWNSTANAMERQAFLAKDAVLVIDDFAPHGTTSDVQRMHREADRLLRAQGNRAGRARMRPDGSLRPEYFPRCMILSSGEDVPAGQSLRARLMILEAEAGRVVLKALTLAQASAAKGIYAQAMAAFIRWIAPRLDEFKKSLPAKHREHRERARASVKAHDRTPDAVASLFLGWEVFLEFAKDTGAIDESELDRMWADAWETLCKVAMAQAGHQASEELTARFMALLESALESGDAHVASAETENYPVDPTSHGWRQDGPDWIPQGERIGWVDQHFMYLLPDAVFGAVQKLAKSQGSTLPVTPRTMWNRLAEKGLIAKDGRNFAVKKSISNRKIRVLRFSREVLLPTSRDNRDNRENPYN